MRNYIFLTVLLVTFFLAGTSHAEEWWEIETRMEEGGRLDLSEKPWWSRAMELKCGEEFSIRSTEAENPEWMIVKRVKRTHKKDAEMIVWILDDDGDMREPFAGDTDSDCYVADYNCDGTVDRLVDYIDEDGDGIPDEMDIRYFVDSELRRAWFGMDLDGDGKMWGIVDYEYAGGFFNSDPYGNNMIYMNKFNPNTHEWMPISECPFAFFDADNDGHSDVVARFSAVPLDFSPKEDPDYANSGGRYQGPHYESLESMGILNVRYSFDIDGLASQKDPLHYEMGFNLIGHLPYHVEGMNHHQPLRRAPKSTVCVPHDKVREVAETYPATQTGFTWREFEDANISIGDPSRPDYDRRWEGVFWTWERRIMHNTGGPFQDWNSRREYMPMASNHREVYYSPVDRRIHLKGAEEGWLRVGHLAESEVIGEIRMFDTNKDGYFDRWEYYYDEGVSPYRVASVPDVENRDLGNDWAMIQDFYTGTVLPEALQWNEKVIAALERSHSGTDDSVLVFLRKALEKDISPDERRYVLDLIRERHYHLLQCERQKETKTAMGSLPQQDPRSIPVVMEESTEIWSKAVWLSRLDAAYSRGDYLEVINMLR